MAVIEFSKSDLFALAGKRMDDRELENTLAMMGVPLEHMEDDRVEVEVFPNRPDLLSVEGLARALRSYLSILPGMRKYETGESGIKVMVDGSVREIRPYIVCGVVRDVNFTDELIASIMQIQEKLHATIGRRRKKAAIGIYDLDTIDPPVIYKALEPNMIEFVPLSDASNDYGYMSAREILIKHPKGKDYAHLLENLDRFPLLVDSKDMVLSMPPIINSDDTRVHEETKNLFIDVTGTHLRTIHHVLNIVATTIAEREAKLETVEIVYPASYELNNRTIRTPDLSPVRMNLSVKYVNRLLGLNLSPEDVAHNLRRMGFEPQETGETISVLIPAYRTDIMHPMDLVEDVAIAYGYDRFDYRLPDVFTVGESLPVEIIGDTLREIMVGLGFTEVMNFIITSREKLTTKIMRGDDTELAEIDNYNSPEYTTLRDTHLPSLLDALNYNRMNAYPQKIFEIGDTVVLDSNYETGARTVRKLGIAVAGGDKGLTEIAEIIHTICSLMKWDHEFRSEDIPGMIPGRSCCLISDNRAIGFFGELHPQVIVEFNLEVAVVYGEINIEAMSRWSEEEN